RPRPAHGDAETPSEFRCAGHQPTLRRLDQAAGAADATREARSSLGVAYGSQEVSCDPLSPHHAGGAPAPSLLADYHSQLSLRGGTVRPTLQVSARPAQSHAPA